MLHPEIDVSCQNVGSFGELGMADQMETISGVRRGSKLLALEAVPTALDDFEPPPAFGDPPLRPKRRLRRSRFMLHPQVAACSQLSGSVDHLFNGYVLDGWAWGRGFCGSAGISVQR